MDFKIYSLLRPGPQDIYTSRFWRFEILPEPALEKRTHLILFGRSWTGILSADHADKVDIISSEQRLFELGSPALYGCNTLTYNCMFPTFKLILSVAYPATEAKSYFACF
jgi:hypothetical protein